MDFLTELTGYVGSATFNARSLKQALAKAADKPVNILIDSFGGSLPEGLSVCGALRDHGQVTVHFRGMNASAATIASMGAKKISMAPEAMYLVHKVSMDFYDWASRNSDQLDQFIQALKEAKADLDTMDRSIAQLYASRCKKHSAKDILSLMEKGRWLTAQQALDFGFIDEISDQCGDKKKKCSITNVQACALEAQGLPVPPVPIEEDDRKGLVAQIVDGIKNILKPSKMDDTNNTTNNTTASSAASSTANSAANTTANSTANGTNGSAPDANAAQHNAQQQAPEAQGNHAEAVPEADASPKDQSAEIESLKAEIASLKAQLGKAPAQSTSSVKAAPDAAPIEKQDIKNTQFDNYCRTSASAKKLFDSIP